MKTRSFITTLILVALALLVAATVQAEPKTVTISGTVVDYTCATKGKAMTGKNVNTMDEHDMGGGKKAPGCATMCLKGGQPAALYDGKDISAVFACNPAATLANYAGKEVDVQGFYGGKPAFVPAKIRTKGGDWQDVQCTAMH